MEQFRVGHSTLTSALPLAKGEDKRRAESRRLKMASPCPRRSTGDQEEQTAYLLKSTEKNAGTRRGDLWKTEGQAGLK